MRDKPRKPFIPVTQFPYHVTNRCNNQEWFKLPLPVVWQVFCEQLCDSGDQFSVWIHNFVLMNNHFHLLLTTPLGNLDAFLRHFLTEVARKLKFRSRRINHVFGGRTSQSILDNPYSVAYVYKYIYRNPVRVGISDLVEDYRFSTLPWLIQNKCPIPIVEGIEPLWSLIPKDPRARIDWLNLPTAKEQEILITRGLRRGYFQFSRSNEVRKQLQALASSYGIPSGDPYLLGPKGE